MMVAARVVAAAGHQVEVAGQVLPPVLQVLPAVFPGAVAALAVEEVLEVGNYIFFNTEANLFISVSEL